VKVLVDTSIWSLALRRKRPGRKDQMLIDELAHLIRELRAILIGPVRQEVLSGLSDASRYELVRRHLAAFDDRPIETVDYEEAARLFNKCRKQGVQGSQIDFLICAAAMRGSLSVFTTDKDFTHYSQCLDLRLHTPRIRT